MRGVNIGSVKDIKLKLNTVIVLINIKSTDILIPKNSIIEATQTGLLKDVTIDITPLEIINLNEVSHIDHFSNYCYTSRILCNYHHLYGERGINYDDLVRSTTRISQRFDDPRFFNLCYLLIQRLNNISNIMLDFTYDVNKITFLIASYLDQYVIENF
uniref:Mce/MlaD domain-containing protein n=1 Tax=Gelidium kathyanniae TaxID=2483893 RepID=A0A3G2QY02_9FLOR|nr:hypothetical protein [Gelidium kathyanniae]AYO27912.1 hypothetical protein [Gelidium kathyanniae]